MRSCDRVSASEKRPYVSDGAAVDAGDDDGPVAAHAEPEALVVQLAQMGQAGRVPLVLCREQSERTQRPEQILDRMLLEVRLAERQLQLRRRCKHRTFSAVFDSLWDDGS